VGEVEGDETTFGDKSQKHARMGSASRPGLVGTRKDRCIGAIEAVVEVGRASSTATDTATLDRLSAESLFRKESRLSTKRTTQAIRVLGKRLKHGVVTHSKGETSWARSHNQTQLKASGRFSRAGLLVIIRLEKYASSSLCCRGLISIQQP